MKYLTKKKVFTLILRQLIASVFNLIVFSHSHLSIDQIFISLASLLPLAIVEPVFFMNIINLF